MKAQTSEKPAKHVTTTVRIDRNLHDRMRDIARKEHRSLNQQIVVFLRQQVARNTTICGACNAD